MKLYRAVSLFVRLVWRDYEGKRISIREAGLFARICL